MKKFSMILGMITVGFGLYYGYVLLRVRDLSLSSSQQKNSIPSHLYKIVSIADWQASKDRDVIQLLPMDKDFIHLATDRQLENIITKFWSQEADVVVITLDTKKILGDLVLEQNPGGVNKYYHLYNGSLPLSAVVAVEIRKVK